MPTINFPPFDQIVNPKFAPLFENQDRYILSWGGRNGSRSSSWAIILIYRCLLHKYFRCILIRKTFASIKDSQWQTIKDFVEDLGLSSLFTFKVSPLEIVCVNDNKFICRGMDKVEKLKSLKDYTCAWYEEGNQITEKDFITVTTTIRSLKADFLQEIFTFNPETEEHYEDFWLWKKFFQGHSEFNFRHKTVTTFKLHGIKKVVESWYTSQHSTYKDNRYLDDEQIAIVEELKEANPYYYTVFTLGHWGNKEVSDKFWKGFNRIRHVKDDIYLDIEKPIHIVFDENVNPYPALQIWQFDEIDEVIKNDRVITPKKIDVRQVHEICLTNPNNKLKKVARELVRWLTVQGWVNMIYIYGEASSKKEDTKLEEGMNYFTMFRDALLIEKYKVRIKKSAKNPPVAMSAEFINECLDSNFGGIHISISSSCKESVNDYLLVQEKTDGTMKKPKNSDGVELLGHCFVGETLIETDKGAIKIKDIKAGDLVLTRSGYKKVLLSQLTRRGAKVNDYLINGNVLTCTPDHPIYTKNRGFIPASELIGGDVFCISGKEANSYATNIKGKNIGKRMRVPFTEKYKDVYNLKVDDCPEFFANNVLVHNCSDCFRYIMSEAFKDQFKEYIRRRPQKGKTHHVVSSKKARKY